MRIQVGSSRTDSPVRFSHAQPGSHISTPIVYVSRLLDARGLSSALELAIVLGRSVRPDLIDYYLKLWLEAAIDAAHLCQTLRLQLRPWECWPPCDVAVGETDTHGLEHRGIAKSATLLRKMQSLGISRYHPDPVAAIAAAERAA